MVKGDDPPATAHHLRLEVADLSQFIEPLKTFPWSKAIVCHQSGKTGEHPHLHIFFQLERELTRVALKNRLKAHHDVFKSLYGQSQWSFRPHDSYTIWCKYVCKNLSHSIIKSDEELDTIHEEAPQVPIVANGPLQSSNVPPARAIVVRKSRAMRDRFISYLEKERNWKIGEHFIITAETPASYWGQCEREVIEAATEYWEAAFSFPEGERMCRYALYKFSCEEMREVIKDKMVERIKKSLW